LGKEFSGKGVLSSVQRLLELDESRLNLQGGGRVGQIENNLYFKLRLLCCDTRLSLDTGKYVRKIEYQELSTRTREDTVLRIQLCLGYNLA
jgi:hypothetical protein